MPNKINFSQMKGQVINALDYGAISGTTDCAAWLTAAYAAAVAARKPLYIPAGIYYVQSTLTWDGNVDVFGDGQDLTIIRNSSSATLDCIVIEDHDGIWVRQMTIDGIAGTGIGVGNGVRVYAGEKLKLTHMNIKNHPGHGLLLQGGNIGYYANIRVASNGYGNGGATRYDGIRIHELTGYPGSSVRACTFVNIDAITNYGNGVYIYAGPFNHFLGLCAQQNVYNGFKTEAAGTVGTMYLEANVNSDLTLTVSSYGNNISLTYCGSIENYGANNSFTLALQDGGFANEIAHVYDPIMNPVANASAYGSVSGMKVVEAASGTHPMFVVKRIKKLVKTAGSAAVNKHINLLVEEELTGAVLENLSAQCEGPVRFMKDIRLQPLTPAQITADQNNYAPGYESVWRLSSDAPRNITGIAAGGDVAPLFIINVGAQNIVLQNQNAGSLDANKIITGAGADVTLAADDTAMLLYDGATARWRIINTH